MIDSLGIDRSESAEICSPSLFRAFRYNRPQDHGIISKVIVNSNRYSAWILNSLFLRELLRPEFTNII